MALVDFEGTVAARWDRMWQERFARDVRECRALGLPVARIARHLAREVREHTTEELDAVVRRLVAADAAIRSITRKEQPMNVHEQAEQEASAALATVREELAELSDWTIEDEEGNELAGAMLVDVKGRIKALEKKRKSITGPMNTALREVNDLFREPRTRLEEAERLLKGKIAGYLEARREANDAALLAAGQAEGADEASEALARVQEVHTPDGVSMRYRWEPRIVNQGLLMPEFTQPDWQAIREHMNTKKQPDGTPLPIPGVVFDKVPVVAARSK